MCVCVSVKKDTKIGQHVLSQYMQCTSWGHRPTRVLYTEWSLVKGYGGDRIHLVHDKKSVAGNCEHGTKPLGSSR